MGNKDLFNEEAITILLNDKLDIDCDISSVYDSVAKEIIFGLLNNDDIRDECYLPSESTKDILSDVVNSSCGENNKTLDDFYDGLENVMVGDPLDWNTATNDEKVHKILRAMKFANWKEKCGLSGGGVFSLEGIFTNLPLQESWGDGQTLHPTCIGVSTEAKEIEFTLKINFGLMPFGDRKLYSMPWDRRVYEMTDYFDFVYYKNSMGNPDPAMLMNGHRSDMNVINDYILDTKDWKCPVN